MCGEDRSKRENEKKKGKTLTLKMPNKKEKSRPLLLSVPGHEKVILKQ
jgi:hypothetical protein